MKRIVLIICALLIGLATRAQSVTYTCRYWFDQNFVQATTTTFSNGTWQADLDVGSLADGLHTLHLHVMDSSMKWSAPQNYFFLKTAQTQQENCVYHCWFDDDFANKQTDSLGNGNFLLDVSDLEEGLHTLNVILQGNSLTATQSYMFMRVEMLEVNGVDMSNLTYHCWFDEDFEHQQTDSLRDGNFLLDVTNLSNGLHSVSVMLEGGTGTLTPRKCYYFYKIPYGGNGLNKWEYCVNEDWANRITTNIVPSVDTLSIISLLPVPTQSVRSSCFHFHPNGDEPYLNAKNEITLRFWTADEHFIDRSAFYVDEYVSEPIQADDLERNTTVCIPAPRDNQMQWYKVPLVVGDSIAFRTDKACTVQLFAPSGEEVYAATASEALVFGGIHAWEDGDYYLVVHDATGSGDEICLTNVYVHKYAILAYDVHLAGNGGCSTITFQGNGFNSLLDAYLVNYQNDTIRRLDIGHESNTTTTVTFDFYQVNLGVYDAVFQFYGETIRINGALEVQEPVDIILTSSVSYPSQFLRNTPCTYTYTITNNGNMSAYGVPLFVYISSATFEGISHIEFEGFELPSLFDDMVLDSLTPNQIAEIKEWVSEWGDEQYLSFLQTIDDETGDTIIARCNYFFVNLAPFETKTLKLKITANELLDVWMTVPSETIQPVILDSNRGLRYQFCCVSEKVECFVRIVSDRLNIASLVTDALALAGTALNLAGPLGTTVSAVLLAIAGFTTIASCLATTGNEIIQRFNDVVCSDIDESWWHNFYHVALPKSGWSIWHVLMSCIPMSKLFKIASPKEVEISLGYLKEALFKHIAGLATDGLAMISPVEMDCMTEYHEKWPNCPNGDHDGGPSEPVNSLDPNDIYGYLSESGSHYMRQEIQNVQYEIEFENDTTLATAAAHTIIVRDTLDATKFDLNSLAARSVTIGDKRLDLNGEQTFARTLDLRPEINVIAQINQDYDPTTGIIQWTIQSLDPMTMEPTDDPNQGVLPVNFYGDGVGFIDYSIDIKEPFADGTEINNRAGIIFDQEDQILTPIWTNIVDAVKPTSHIEEVTLMGDSLSFSFVSSDNRSGVWYHSLYYRNASTELEWLVKKAQILGNSFMLPFDSLQTTEYFVIAVDSAGNVEAMKTEAEVVVESSVSGYPFFVAGYGESTNAGWKFIASPVEGSIEAATVDNIFSATQSDLYYFDQGEESEWRNYKSAPFELENGKGYLYATKEDKTLIFRGAYNEADAYEVPLVYTGANPHTDMRGWNLIGNPFTVPAYVNRSYYKMNEEGTAIEPVAVSEGTPISACHGVMVKAETSDETVTFSRTAQQAASNQGNIQIAVAQATMRGNIKQDKAVVSFNPNDQLGKFNFNESTTKVYIPQDGKDYAIAYAAKSGEIPVNFKATKNGEYTMNVNTNGMEFNYLHLIDNLTGADVDLLPLCKGDEGGFNEPQQATYTFTAKTTDYASRFKLVFSVCGDADGDNAPFAFINNGNIIIVGAEAGSTLQIVDVLGRVLVCRDASHVSAISTTGMTKGVYVLRLINGDDVKTQKIVIQ